MLRGDVIAPDSSLKGGCGEVEVSLCSQVTAIRGNDLKLYQIREVVGSPSLQVLKNHGDVALRNVVSGHGEP